MELKLGIFTTRAGKWPTLEIFFPLLSIVSCKQTGIIKLSKAHFSQPLFRYLCARKRLNRQSGGGQSEARPYLPSSQQLHPLLCLKQNSRLPCLLRPRRIILLLFKYEMTTSSAGKSSVVSYTVKECPHDYTDLSRLLLGPSLTPPPSCFPFASEARFK